MVERWSRPTGTCNCGCLLAWVYSETRRPLPVEGTPLSSIGIALTVGIYIRFARAASKLRVFLKLVNTDEPEFKEANSRGSRMNIKDGKNGVCLYKCIVVMPITYLCSG